MAFIGPVNSETLMNRKLKQIAAWIAEERAKTVEQLIEESNRDENVQMFRRIRSEISRKYPTIEALSAYLDEVEEKLRQEGTLHYYIPPKPRKKSAAAKASRVISKSPRRLKAAS